MTPFSRSHGDCWLKFPIGDVFPKDDPLARDIVRMLVADEDLSNIEHFKLILEGLDSKTDAISRAKWNRAQFFLLRLRFGFLSNVLDEVVFKEYARNKRPTFETLIKTMPVRVQKAYDELRDAMRTGGRANAIIGKFRNSAAFHYSDHEFMKALGLLADKTGEIIANEREGVTRDLHFIVGYQVLDVIPAGHITEEDVNQIKEVADRIQGLFHVLAITSLDQYLLQRLLNNKFTREDTSVPTLTEEIQLVSENLDAVVGGYVGKELIQGHAFEHGQAQDL